MHGRRAGTFAFAAGILSAVILGAAPPAAARVTVSAQFTFGAVVAGGAGFIVLIAGEWSLPFASADLPTALIEIRDGRARLGVPLPMPLPLPTLETDTFADRVRADGIELDLVRWRF